MGIWREIFGSLWRKPRMTPQSNDFDRAMAFVFRWEGGLVDDPDDPGGLTNYGISFKYHGYLGRDGVKNMTPQKAAAIYRVEYWDRVGGDKLPWPLNLAAFDAAINPGLARALAFLDRALKSDKGSKEKAQIICNMRRAYYSHLVFKNKKMAKYEKGWNNRVKDLERLINQP